MKKIAYAIGVLATTLLLNSCEKKDDNNNTNNNGSGNNNNNSTSSALSNKKWKMVSSVSSMNMAGFDQQFDLYGMLEECVKDNLITFETNSTITVDEGATKCDAADPQTQTDGNWELLENDTKFRMWGANSVQGITELTADIITLDNTTFTIKYVTDQGGVPMTTTTSYQVQ